MVLNGQVIHEGVELKTPTGHAWKLKEIPRGPLLLQGDHGPVAFRNIRVREIDVIRPESSDGRPRSESTKLTQTAPPIPRRSRFAQEKCRHALTLYFNMRCFDFSRHLCTAPKCAVTP